MKDEVAVIGVGNIGAPIAKRLRQCGYTVTACDVRADALQPLAMLGMRTTVRACDCASAAVVLVVVANGAQLDAVLNGVDGLLAGVDPLSPCRLVVMSTVAPHALQALVPALSQKNVAVVDAPVSGGVIGAEQGTLTIVVGGNTADIEPLRPLFADLGTVHRAGPLGTGMIVKIINNVIGVTNIYLTAEALQLARQLDIAPEQVAAIMEQSSGRNAGTRDLSRYRRAWGEVGIDLPHMQSAIDISTKDLTLALDLARDAGAQTPLLAALREAFAGATAAQVGAIWSALGTEK